LKKHRESLLTFLEEDIDYHNNTAERALRSSVVMRKITGGGTGHRRVFIPMRSS